MAGEFLELKKYKKRTPASISMRILPFISAIRQRSLSVLAHLHRVGMDKDIRWTRQFAARFVRVLVLAGMSVPLNQIPVRASALTYTTILSIVPLAVILSAVAGQFGYLDLLSPLVISIADSMNLDINLDPILEVIQMAQKVDFHRLGLVGSLGLLGTFFLAMGNIELAIDHIWDIRVKRKLWPRLKAFTPLLILLIILLLAVGKIILGYRKFLEVKSSGVLMTHFLHETVIVMSVLALIGFLWLGLVLLFYLIPNTKVRLGPAIIAASVSTSLLYILSKFLILFPDIFLSKNNIIYGSFALVPAILLLIYLMWLIVLYGAAVGFIFQRLYHLRDKEKRLIFSDSKAFHRMEREIYRLLKTIHALSGSAQVDGKLFVPIQNLSDALLNDANSLQIQAAPLVDLGLVVKRKIRTGIIYAPRLPLAEVNLTALHNLLVSLDPKGLGRLRTQTAIDELKHTLSILYSTGKGSPPLYLSTILGENLDNKKL